MKRLYFIQVLLLSRLLATDDTAGTEETDEGEEAGTGNAGTIHSAGGSGVVQSPVAAEVMVYEANEPELTRAGVTEQECMAVLDLLVPLRTSAGGHTPTVPEIVHQVELERAQIKRVTKMLSRGRKRRGRSKDKTKRKPHTVDLSRKVSASEESGAGAAQRPSPNKARARRQHLELQESYQQGLTADLSFKRAHQQRVDAEVQAVLASSETQNQECASDPKPLDERSFAEQMKIFCAPTTDPGAVATLPEEICLRTSREIAEQKKNLNAKEARDPTPGSLPLSDSEQPAWANQESAFVRGAKQAMRKGATKRVIGRSRRKVGAAGSLEGPAKSIFGQTTLPELTEKLLTRPAGDKALPTSWDPSQFRRPSGARSASPPISRDRFRSLSPEPSVPARPLEHPEPVASTLDRKMLRLVAKPSRIRKARARSPTIGEWKKETDKDGTSYWFRDNSSAKEGVEVVLHDPASSAVPLTTAGLEEHNREHGARDMITTANWDAGHRLDEKVRGFTVLEPWTQVGGGGSDGYGSSGGSGGGSPVTLPGSAGGYSSGGGSGYESFDSMTRITSGGVVHSPDDSDRSLSPDDLESKALAKTVFDVGAVVYLSRERRGGVRVGDRGVVSEMDIGGTMNRALVMFDGHDHRKTVFVAHLRGTLLEAVDAFLERNDKVQQEWTRRLGAAEASCNSRIREHKERVEEEFEYHSRRLVEELAQLQPRLLATQEDLAESRRLLEEAHVNENVSAQDRQRLQEELRAAQRDHTAAEQRGAASRAQLATTRGQLAQVARPLTGMSAEEVGGAMARGELVHLAQEAHEALQQALARSEAALAALQAAPPDAGGAPGPQQLDQTRELENARGEAAEWKRQHEEERRLLDDATGRFATFRALAITAICLLVTIGAVLAGYIFVLRRRAAAGDGAGETMPLERDLVKHNDWSEVRAIGQGAYGSVRLAMNNANGKYFAVKRLFLGNTEEQFEKRLQLYQKEVSIMSALSHKHIVSCLGHSADLESRVVYIYLEYVGAGSLRSLLTYIEGPLEPAACARYIGQIVDGLRYLHSEGVVHRDLKPGNVLIATDGSLKLADFGTAKDLSVLTHTTKQTICGTPAYIAPEVARRWKHTTASDIYSLGAMAFEMAAGQVPFSHRSRMKYLASHAERNEARPVAIPWPERVTVPPTLRAFITECLDDDPAARPCAEDLPQHPMFQTPPRDVKAYLQTMLSETALSTFHKPSSAKTLS